MFFVQPFELQTAVRHPKPKPARTNPPRFVQDDAKNARHHLSQWGRLDSHSTGRKVSQASIPLILGEIQVGQVIAVQSWPLKSITKALDYPRCGSEALPGLCC